MTDVIRTSYYRIEPKGDRIELHLHDNHGETFAVLDVSLNEWQQIWRGLPPKRPPMSMATDHAVVMGTSRW